MPERGAASPHFLTQESSAYRQPARERRLTEAEVEALRHPAVHEAADEAVDEAYFEQRQNGTNGHAATVLQFHPVVHADNRRVAPRAETREATASGNEDNAATASAKPMRPTVVKPRVKAEAKEAKKEGPEAMSGTKPPRVGVNIEWVQKGVGWDCREVYYVGKQRRRRHLGHIGRQKWEEMQAQFGGTALEAVLREWIEARRAEKSISLNGR